LLQKKQWVLGKSEEGIGYKDDFRESNGDVQQQELVL